MTNHRFISGLLLIVSLGAVGIGYLILQQPQLFGLCSLNTPCYSEFWTYGLAKPLFWGLRLLPVLFLVLVFVRREVFNTWLKCTWWLAVVGLILIALTPYQFTGYMPDRTKIAGLVVEVYVAVSFVVIVWKYWRLRGK